MHWVYGLSILMLVGGALRFLLRLDASSNPHPKGVSPLSPERDAIYQPVAQELETHAAMLAISLNDAFAERNAQRDEIAWRLVRLSVSEWSRLAEILGALLNAMSKYTARLEGVVPIHSIVARRFKSRLMIDYVRLHELLDQIVFRSKRRFQLQIRLLRRSGETLTAEIRRTYRYLDRTGDDSEEVWKRLDLYFHDFDLVNKEALLAFRAFLACLPQPLLIELAAELKAVLEHGVRSANL